MSRAPLDRAIDDLTQSIGLLLRRVRAAAASSELSLTESAVLARLDKDGPATTADLARAEAVKPQSMGATVQTLENMGLVARTAHPTDGRQFLIRLTAKGAAIRTSAKEAKRTWIAYAIRDLDQKERETLLKAGEIFRRMAEK